jgi:hypothetical protein
MMAEVTEAAMVQPGDGLNALRPIVDRGVNIGLMDDENSRTAGESHGTASRGEDGCFGCLQGSPEANVEYSGILDYTVL